MLHAGTKEIITERLLLRKIRLSDAEMMFNNWTGDEKVTRFLRWDAHKAIEETEKMIQNWIDEYRLVSTYYWGIYLQNGVMIGSIGVTIISEYDLTGSLGFKIGSRWWGCGYAGEAIKAVLGYMFQSTDIERIESYNSVENPASGKVMKSSGMLREGFAKHKYRNRDGFHDCELYGITREYFFGSGETDAAPRNNIGEEQKNV